jgi:formate hydrogenlyase subunit 6/NADH:ubiquinone oxidoreductase subunit I
VKQLKLERYGIGIAKGMTVTLKHLFRHPTVSQYPEQRLHFSKRTRGNELVWDNIRCTGCGTCSKTCPQGVIEIVTSVMTEENKYKVEKFQVDTGYCISCGLCVEACPYAALFMGYSVERAKYRRDELVQNLDQLLVSPERPRSAYFHPEFEKDLPRQTLLLEKITEKE